MRHFTNKELLQHVDPTTELEQELFRRMEALVQECEAYAPLVALVDKKFGDPSPEYVEKIFEVMDEFSCDDHTDLHEKLERADKFYDIASDAGDVIERLSKLVSQTQ